MPTTVFLKIDLFAAVYTLLPRSLLSPCLSISDSPVTSIPSAQYLTHLFNSGWLSTQHIIWRKSHLQPLCLFPVETPCLCEGCNTANTKTHFLPVLVWEHAGQCRETWTKLGRDDNRHSDTCKQESYGALVWRWGQTVPPSQSICLMAAIMSKQSKNRMNLYLHARCQHFSDGENTSLML